MPSKKNKNATKSETDNNGGLFSSVKEAEASTISNVASLFSKPAPTLKEQAIAEEEEVKVNLVDKTRTKGKQNGTNHEEDDETDEILPIDMDNRPDDGYKPFIDENQSAYANKERTERTIFVGNIDVNADRKDLMRLFKPYGTIENAWIRSVPIEEGKLPRRAAVILNKFGNKNANKNGYILFKSKEEAEKALEANGILFKGSTLRVDHAERKEYDYNTTIFIGNMPYDVSEDDLRQHFRDCGAIVNIRIIRDPQTRQGKGFGYIQFKDDDGYGNALQKNKTGFKGRELRIKKAVRPERLEKKKRKLENRIQDKKAQKEAKKEAKLLRQQEEDALAFASRQNDEDIGQEDIDGIEFKNSIRTSPSQMKKKVEKIMNKKGVDKFTASAIGKKRVEEKTNSQLFGGPDLRKQLKAKRQKREDSNKKKAAAYQRRIETKEKKKKRKEAAEATTAEPQVKKKQKKDIDI